MVSQICDYEGSQIREAHHFSAANAIGVDARTKYDIKLDRVGPVDNRPSTDKLNYFVKKEREKSDM